MASSLTVEVPAVLKPLCAPARYKAAFGGRGGAKSHFFAEQLVIRCYAKKTRAACIREVQATIRDSVRQLLVDKIQKLGFGWAFDILETEIRSKRNGSLIIFRGMQSYNAENIKSLEDFDIAWVEEAQSFSATSLRLLRPTIRKDNSELWFSWNPRFETDAVDKFFRGAEPPANAIIREVNWYDNPWFPSVLEDEKAQDYAADAEMADNVWGGGYEKITEGSYFAKQIAAAEKSGRVGFFPYDPQYPVYTGWDLGVDDYTAIWFLQILPGPMVRVIDYYESSDIGAEEILAEALPEYTSDVMMRAAALVELGRGISFKYQRHFLPHDVGHREWGAGAKTRVQTLNELGVPLSQIHRGIACNPSERINATRQLLPMMQFHQTGRVMKGVNRLRRYRRRLNTALGTYQGPLHDESSHGSDALGEFAVNCGIRAPDEVVALIPKPGIGQIMLPGPPVDTQHPRNHRIRV